MDGRIQRTVFEWVAAWAGAPYVDMITEAGPDGILARREPVEPYRGMHARLGIAVNVHGAKRGVVVGHEDCAGNPVDKAAHFEHIREGVRVVKQWYPDVEAAGIYVNLDGRVERVV